MHDVVISADARGLLEYWSPSTLNFPDQEYVEACLRSLLTSCSPEYIVRKTFSNSPEELMHA